MSVTYGFYNSHNGDRVYDADQFSSFLDGIVYDGVYGAVGNKFYVTADGSSLELIVDTGRAWFDHTWTLNDGYLYLTASDADLDADRIDAVVLEINKESRENKIRIIEGIPNITNPLRPSLTKTENVKQYAIAYIERPAASTVIIQDNITYVVGEAETPLCSALSLAGIPSGGKIGQLLAKSSSQSGAVNWYDIDKLPHDAWYLCDGITEYNVLAAYKFVHQMNESYALKNVNEKTEYILTKNNDNITWHTDTGFYFPGSSGYTPTGLINQSLLNLGPEIRTVIIKYSDATETSKARILSGGWKGNSNNYNAVFESMPYATESYLYKYTNTPGYEIDDSVNKAAASIVQSGIVGVSFKYADKTASLYIDGALTNATKPSGQTQSPIGDVGSVIGTKATTHNYNSARTPNNHNWGSYRVQYALFLNVELTAQQHYDLYYQINSDAQQ